MFEQIKSIIAIPAKLSLFDELIGEVDKLIEANKQLIHDNQYLKQQLQKSLEQKERLVLQLRDLITVARHRK